jgi:hypothetical protein
MPDLESGVCDQSRDALHRSQLNLSVQLMFQSVSDQTAGSALPTKPPVNRVLFGVCCVSVAINGFLLAENRGKLPSAIAQASSTDPNFAKLPQQRAKSVNLAGSVPRPTIETQDLVEFSPNQNLVDNLALLSPMPQPRQLPETTVLNALNLPVISQPLTTISTLQHQESRNKPWLFSSSKMAKPLYIAVYPTNATSPNNTPTLAADRSTIAQTAEPRYISRLGTDGETPFPPAQTPTQLPAPRSSKPKPAATKLAPTNLVYTLVGAMELGDRSAALFELNGITQRYRLGESIGSSGWILAEISQGQIVLHRGGEMRSVVLGEGVGR